MQLKQEEIDKRATTRSRADVSATDEEIMKAEEEEEKLVVAHVSSSTLERVPPNETNLNDEDIKNEIKSTEE